MRSRSFVISDTHFGHKNICAYEAGHRPFSTVQEHDAEMVRRWNSVVTKHDTVWHLGDVLFGVGAFDTLRLLNGNKKLIMGNHDHYPISRYLEHFSKVMASMEVGGCIFTHIPIHPDQFHRYRANVHGHMHSKSLPDQRYVCVSAEQIDLTPILLETILNRLPSKPGDVTK